MSITIGVFARIGPVALLVRVDRLVAVRADRVRRQVAVGHHARVDGRAQVLGRELAAVAQQPALADPARAQRLDAREQPGLGRAQRLLDRAHLAGLLDLALGPERVRPEVEPDPARVELHREPEREALRHLDARAAELLQRQGDHLGRRRLAPVLLDRSGDLRPGQHAVDARLALRAVHLEVAHHEDARRSLLDEQERVGGEEPGRVEDVGVGLGGGVEHAGGRLPALGFFHAGLVYAAQAPRRVRSRRRRRSAAVAARREVGA